MSNNSEFSPVNSADNANQQAQRNADLASIDPKLSRTNYYDGRLLKAADLIRDQLYLDERLREVGRVLGFGVVRGLDVMLSEDGKLTITNGLAVSPAGRVLELKTATDDNTDATATTTAPALQINLYDSAQLGALNNNFRRFTRGLYAVCLQYAEQGSGSSEIYPRDLAAQRGFHFNAYSEGVEIILQPLRSKTFTASADNSNAIARKPSDLNTRAALVAELIGSAANGATNGSNSQPLEISDEAVALGLISIEHGRVSWLDKGLLKRPLRKANSQTRLQEDLHTHYEELLASVLDFRLQSSRDFSFSAHHYFNLLPPYGSVPKAAINPLTASQNYFPQSFDVSIAPVRETDLAAIIAQSKLLAPIDLTQDKGVDIMVLVAMSDHQFAYRARQLEQDFDTQITDKMRYIPELALQLYANNTFGSAFDAVVNPANSAFANISHSQQIVWQDIWSQASNVIYVRRPTRVAETQVSAVVLAAGYVQANPIDAIPADFSQLVADLNQALEEINHLQILNASLLQQIEDGGDSNNGSQIHIQLENALQRITQLESNNAALLTAQNTLQQQLDTAAALTNLLTLQLSRSQAEIEVLQSQLNNSSDNVFSIDQLVNIRGVEDEKALEAAKKSQELVEEKPELLLLINKLLLIVEREYQSLIWRTLVELGSSELLESFVDHYIDTGLQTNTAEFIASQASGFDISRSLREEWEEAAKGASTRTRTSIADGLPNTRGFNAGLPNIDLSNVESLTVIQRAKASGFSNERVIKQVNDLVGSSTQLRLWVNQMAALVPVFYDEALWPTMAIILKNESTQAFQEYVLQARNHTRQLGLAIGATTAFRLTAKVRNQWRDLDMSDIV
ncbi:MAG: hypothetical protein V7784_07710 [Oceanospirillaceae bacterium]